MKMRLFTTMLLISAALCGGCGSTASPDTAPPQDDSASADIQESLPEEEETTPADTAAEETEGTEENEIAENVQFIVDVTDNLIGENGTIVGNTSSAESYCGIIEIHLDTPLIEKAQTEIQPGHTYVFTVTPMMTMSIPPQVTALEYMEASESDIAALEEIRMQTSNFEECMAAYETMSLEDIIQDGNFNYALWTQEQIQQYNEFLTQKGYTEDSSPKSYAKLRNELNGSVPAAAMENRTE